MATSGKWQVRQRAVGRVVRSRGFTLMELMIVVAIIAILAAIAVPTYVTYITKTRRTAATACLSEYANYMERYYTTNLRYDQDTSATPVANTISNATLGCGATTQTGDYYTYQFASTPALSQSTYKILAVPQGVQASRDTQCGTLAIDQSGQRFYQSTLTDATGLSTCWK